MKSTNEMIEVMQAHEQGKVVEWRHMSSENYWQTVTTTVWNWQAFDYRIKPPETEPAPTHEWVVCEVETDTGLYVFSTPEVNSRDCHLGVAPSVPGFGGILYEGCDDWRFNPTTELIPEAKDYVAIKPLKVRFWREVTK